MKIILIAAAAAAIATAQPQGTVFHRALTNVSTAQASGPVPNSGQAVHMLTAVFPTATGSVSGFVARLEARYDNADTWFPISADLTSATHVPASGDSPQFAYGLLRANGVYPAVRVRLVTAAAVPVTLYYSGAQYPIGQVLLAGDRYIPQPPGGSGEDRVTWALCQVNDCAPVADPAPLWIATSGLRMKKCYVAAKQAPAGAPLVFDVKVNGVSVFGASKLTLPAGSTSTTRDTFETPGIAEGNLVTLDILSVGTATPGRNITIVCTLQ